MPIFFGLRRMYWVLLSVLCLVLFSACGVEPNQGLPSAQVAPTSFDTKEQALSQQQSFLFKASRHAIGYSFASSNDLTHGVAGTRHLVFFTEALAQRVPVVTRLFGQSVGELPAPPGGFLLPFSVKISGPNEIVVMDAGGFPSPTVPAIPRVYTYSYTYNRHTKAFSATLTRSVILNTVPFGFAEDIALAPDGSVYISDSVLGQIFQIKPDGTVVQAIAPASFAPEDTIPQLGGCAFPTGVTVDNIPFAPPGGFSPGVGSLLVARGKLFFGSSCGGVYQIPLTSITDQRQPFERAADIQTVSPKPANVQQDTIKGLNFNPNKPNDPYLYGVASFQLSVVRIDTRDGSRKTMLQDPTLFNFPVSAQFLPSLIPGAPSPFLVISDQEHRFSGINTAITEDQFILPFRLTKVFLK